MIGYSPPRPTSWATRSAWGTRGPPTTSCTRPSPTAATTPPRWTSGVFARRLAGWRVPPVRRARPAARRFAVCSRLRTRLLVVLLGLLAGALGGVTSAGAQGPVQVVVDAPANGSTVGPEFTVQGWATSPSGASGVDLVAVYADGDGDAPGRFLGTATYGLSRPDVVAALDQPGLLDTLGYQLPVTLSPGEHRLAVSAHAAGAPSSEGWSEPAAITVTVTTEATARAAPTAAPESRAQPAPPSVAPTPGVTGATVCTSRGP